MPTHFSGTCRNCGCPVSEVDYHCPYCRAPRRNGAGGFISIVVGLALGALLLAAQIDKTTGSDHLGALREWFLP
jgi:hypothetical protein